MNYHLGFPMVTSLLMAVAAHGQSAPPTPGSLARARETMKADEVSGARADYVTMIEHPDHTMTIIRDSGDVHIVEGFKTSQMVGRGITHREVIASHYRPEQGDVITSIARFDSGNRLSTLYDRRAAIEAQVRARANAQGLQIQQAQMQAFVEQQAHTRAAEARRQQDERRNEHESIDHDHERPSREVERHGSVRSGGEGESYTPKPD